MQMRGFLTVLRKELRDCFRDKRSIVMMLLPLFIFPVLLTLYNQQIKAVDESFEERLSLTSETPNAMGELVELLISNGIEVVFVESEDPSVDLKAGKTSLILNKNADGYHIIYDQNSIKSTKAVNVVASVIEASKMNCIHSLLNLHGESVDILSQYNYSLNDVSANSDGGADVLISVLGPMLIVMFIATGGSGIALDLFCGEKERGALEGILSTQICRKPLFFAKVVTVFIFVCFSALISVGGYLITFAIDGVLSGDITKGAFELSGMQIFLFLVITAVFALFTATIISVLSLSAKTVKEGSLRISLFTLIPTVIGGVTMYIETGNVPLFMNMVPIINIVTALKAVFINAVDGVGLWLSVISTAVYGILFLFLGYSLINSERILDK